MSGTSMAAPHISGLIAYFIARDGNTTPSLMRDKIQGAAQKDILANIRVFYTIYFDQLFTHVSCQASGTVNYLAKNL